MTRRQYLRRILRKLKVMRMHLPPVLMRLYEKYLFEDMLRKHKWMDRRGLTPRRTPGTVEQMDGTMVRIKDGDSLGNGRWVRLDSLPPEQQRIILESRERKAAKQKRK